MLVELMISYSDESHLLPYDWLIVHITSTIAQQLNLNSALYLAHLSYSRNL